MSEIACVQSVASLAEADGGPSRAIPALADAVAAAGGRVTLVTRDDKRPLVRPGVDVALRLADSAGYGAAVAAALAGGGVLHDNGIWLPANRAATAAARAAGRPYLISTHGMLEPWALAHRKWRKRLAWAVYQRRALDGAAALVANAEPERATLRARLRLPVATIPNGVVVPDAAPATRPEDGPKTLLFLSRLHPVKNLAGLLDAWAQLCADPVLAHWTLRIAGPDEAGYRAVVAAKIAALRVGDRVVLNDAVPETAKAAAFAAADLFVLPSFTENFGIAAAEALAHGLPVVASTGTPWSELRVHRAGWWVAPDAAALAAALGEAMRLTAAERGAMGARGRAWVAAVFGWPAIGVQMLGVYEWVLHGGRRPDCVDA